MTNPGILPVRDLTFKNNVKVRHAAAEVALIFDPGSARAYGELSSL